jgi:hypothetical protein
LFNDKQGDVMQDHRRAIVMAILFAHLIGCGANPRLGESPSFTKGLAAIDRKDFATASFHFAELAKEGNPESMNNLGVSLLMVDRKEEAIYWFKKASRYGEPNAKSTLKAMSEDVPPSDLVGQHPTQLQREVAEKIIVTTLIGIAVGVAAYHVSQGVPTRSYPYASNKNGINQNVGITPASVVNEQSYLHKTPRINYSGFSDNKFGINSLTTQTRDSFLRPTVYEQEYFHGQSGSSYSNIGRTIFGSDGTSYTRIGNTTFGPGGSSSTRTGNSTFNSDGSSSTQIGNFLFNSDGSSINRIGNTTFGSDGTTCNKIGNFTFCD